MRLIGLLGTALIMLSPPFEREVFQSIFIMVLKTKTTHPEVDPGLVCLVFQSSAADFGVGNFF